MKNRILYLMRHGESKGNVDVSLCGRYSNFEIGLTNKGQREAQRAGDYLRSKFKSDGSEFQLDETIQAYCSPYLRTTQTAQIALPELDFQRELLIREICYGQAEGLTMEQYLDQHPDQKRLCKLLGFMYYRLPQGETHAEVYTRCGLFVEKTGWFSEASYNIVVAHRTACLMLDAYLLRQEPQPDAEWKNTEIRSYKLCDKRENYFRKAVLL